MKKNGFGKNTEFCEYFGWEKTWKDDVRHHYIHGLNPFNLLTKKS